MKRKGRTCEVCSTTYDATYAAQRTCSRECGQAISRRGPSVFEWRCAVTATWCVGCGVAFVSQVNKIACSPKCWRIHKGHTPSGSVVEATCACGARFTYTLKSNARTTCDECRASNRKAAKRRAPSRQFRKFNERGRHKCRSTGAAYEPIDRAVVLERDAWVCGICGDSIDPRLHHSDLMAASLDHIVPLSRGGDHTYANVQAAHSLCNAYKSATDLDLRVAA